MTTLVLIPGLLCDEFVWEEQRRALSGDARVWIADHGALNSLTGMATAVLENAPSETFALAGHSMGGRVALEVFRLAPHRVQRLALLDTGYSPRSDGLQGEKERASRLGLLDRARKFGMREMGREWAAGMVHPSRIDTPIFTSLLDMIERKTPDVFAAQIEALLARPDATAQLLAITCPALVLCGRQDNWSPLSQHQHMAATIRGARLQVIEECGHMSTVERPEAVSSALAEWLRGKEDTNTHERPT